MSKTLLITGASRGIGRACAILAAEKGWRVGINYHSDERSALETLQLVREKGGSGLLLRADVAKEEEVKIMFSQCSGTLGPIDGLINNAGIVASASLLADMEIARWRKLFDTNILGAFLCAREAARWMMTDRNGRGGTIVNVSSAAARLGSPGEYIDYAASKGAIDTMTIGLAKELAGRGIRVNAVRPGLIDTDIHTSGGQPDRLMRLGPTVPMQRAGTALEVAEAMIWLSSEESSYVTGALLDVAGGR